MQNQEITDHFTSQLQPTGRYTSPQSLSSSEKNFFRQNSSDLRDFFFVQTSSAGIFEQAVKLSSSTKKGYESSNAMTLKSTLWHPKQSAFTLVSGHFLSDRRDFFFVQISSAGIFEQAVKLSSSTKIGCKSSNAMTPKSTLGPPRMERRRIPERSFSLRSPRFFLRSIRFARH